MPEHFSFPNDDRIFVRDILPVHREIMLDVVLIWARVDYALTEFLGARNNLNLQEAVEKFRKKPYSQKTRQIKSMVTTDDKESTFLVNELRHFPEHIRIRHRITHSGCSGYLLQDPDYILFLVPEIEGDGLAVELIPIQEMRLSHQYAVRLEKNLRTKSDEHYGERHSAN